MMLRESRPARSNTTAMPQVVVVGSYIQDLAFRTRMFPAPGETRIGSFCMGPGGKGFNQAVACHRQGVATLFIGATGADSFRQEVLKFAEQEGLRAELQVFEEHSTGAASIVVNDEAENLIVVSLGACAHLSPAHVERFAAEIGRSRVVVSQAECNLAAVRRAFELARDAGAITVWNPAPINTSVGRDMLQSVDVLVPNETEFQFLLEHLFGRGCPPAVTDPELHELCALLGVPVVILTLGANGCFLSRHPGGEYYRLPALEVEAVDTTGAGDAFTGGLAAGLVRQGGDFCAAARFATAVAGLSTTRGGTAPAMPTAAEVQPFIAG